MGHPAKVLGEQSSRGFESLTLRKIHIFTFPYIVISMNIYLGNDFNKETDEAVFFYTPLHYSLDNFSAFSIKIWGKNFPTSEHAYQWRKYYEAHPDIAEEILSATSPNQVKNISDQHKDKVPESFVQNKQEIMKEILLTKIDQHEKVKRVLIETESKTIVENSPTDMYWGIADGTGENVLGKIWMDIRDGLQ